MSFGFFLLNAEGKQMNLLTPKLLYSLVQNVAIEKERMARDAQGLHYGQAHPSGKRSTSV